MLALKILIDLQYKDAKSYNIVIHYKIIKLFFQLQTTLYKYINNNIPCHLLHSKSH